MKPKFKIMTIVPMMTFLFGCAGMEVKEPSVTVELLPEMVHESFQLNLQDAATRHRVVRAPLT